jgi:hypothetical protein
MNLREAFESVPKRRGGIRCATCVALSSMGADDAETLRELMASSVSTAVIAESCRRAGYSAVSEGSLKRHRRGDCLGLP